MSAHRIFKFLLTVLTCASVAYESGFAYTGSIRIINQCEPWVGNPAGSTKFTVWHTFEESARRGCRPLSKSGERVESLETDPIPRHGDTTVTVISKVHHVSGDVQCAYTIYPTGVVNSPLFHAGDVVTCSQGSMSVCGCEKTGSM